MKDFAPIPPMHSPIIYDIMLVDRITRPHAGHFPPSESLPGHLIHIVTEGEVEQTASGITQRFGPNSVIWYHENEQVQGKILTAPWTFYTINFNAPLLLPPPIDQRIQTVSPDIINLLSNILTIWRNKEMNHIKRKLKVHALVHELIAELMPSESDSLSLDTTTELWWKIEAELRKDLSQPIELRDMEELCQRSQRSIIRACHFATNMPPMKRIKHLRMSYSRGLVRYSSLTMSQIALKVGYGRVQEFSRDYKRHYNCTPTQDRTDTSSL